MAQEGACSPQELGLAKLALETETDRLLKIVKGREEHKSACLLHRKRAGEYADAMHSFIKASETLANLAPRAE